MLEKEVKKAESKNLIEELFAKGDILLFKDKKYFEAE